MAEESQIREETTGAAPEAESQEGVLSEEYQAQRLAERLGIEYVNLEHFEIDPELFRSIPVDLMFRYNFVPRHRIDTGLVIVVADPTDVLMIDELELLLGASIIPLVWQGGRSALLEEVGASLVFAGSVCLIVAAYLPWLEQRNLFPFSG